MSEAKPYTREEIVAIRRMGSFVAERFLVTLAAVEAERDAALAEVERLREALDYCAKALRKVGCNQAADVARAALAPQPEVKGEQP